MLASLEGAASLIACPVVEGPAICQCRAGVQRHATGHERVQRPDCVRLAATPAQPSASVSCGSTYLWRPRQWSRQADSDRSDPELRCHVAVHLALEILLAPTIVYASRVPLEPSRRPRGVVVPACCLRKKCSGTASPTPQGRRWADNPTWQALAEAFPARDATAAAWLPRRLSGDNTLDLTTAPRREPSLGLPFRAWASRQHQHYQ
jgi:hypothetical protein